jgi:hypothetical protein
MPTDKGAWGNGIVAYVGCGRDAGHHLYGPKGRAGALEGHPLGTKLDGCYVPGRGSSGPEGVVRFTREDGYTILGFRDNSIDRRPGSHATFAIKGDHAYCAALDAARLAFPWVFERIEARGITLTREASRV